LPFAPLMVLKKTIPQPAPPTAVALVFAPCRVRKRRALPLASLMNRTATPAVLVFAIVNCFAVPAPPGRPSKVTNCAPFKSTFAAVVSALVMRRFTAPSCGRTVRVFTVVVVRFVKVSGKVSTGLTYAGCYSSMSAPPRVCACTSAVAAPMFAQSPVGPIIIVPESGAACAGTTAAASRRKKEFDEALHEKGDNLHRPQEPKREECSSLLNRLDPTMRCPRAMSLNGESRNFFQKHC